MSRVTALITAAGRGSRMNSSIPKQYMEIDGMPILSRAIDAFEKSRVDEIVIVCPQGDEYLVWESMIDPYKFSKVISVVAGGAERYNSVFNGLKSVTGDIVLIHDGARPFITPDVINMIIDETEKYGAVVAGMPVKDTIKIADSEGFIASTTERDLTWQIQTPQAFYFNDLMAAYEKVIPQAAELKITDDSMVYETAYPDRKIKLVEAGYGNIKITTQEDLR